VKRKALTLKNDADANGKYVAGLREVRVRSREVSRRFSLLQPLSYCRGEVDFEFQDASTTTDTVSAFLTSRRKLIP